MSTEERMQAIYEALASLKPSVCQLTDESFLHHHHEEAELHGGGHFALAIVSSQFENLTRLARHRLIYRCLSELMQRDIHALRIEAKTPTEWAR